MGFGHRIKAARELAGMDQATLARRAGVPQPTLSALESRDSSRSNYSEALIAALPGDVINKLWVRTGNGSIGDTSANVLEGPIKFSYAVAPAARVPVMGTARLQEDDCFDIAVARGTVEGDGSLEINVGDQHAYALRIRGMSLFPAIRDGWFIVIQPGRKTHEGEYVILELADGRRLIKELLYRRESTLEFLTASGKLRQTFDVADVAAVMPIIAVVPPSRWVRSTGQVIAST